MSLTYLSNEFVLILFVNEIMAMFLPFIYHLGSIMTRAAMFQVDYTLHHEQCSPYPALIGVQVMLAR